MLSPISRSYIRSQISISISDSKLRVVQVFKRYLSEILSNKTDTKVKVLDNGKLVEWEADELIKKISLFSKTHFDIGTGDGKYVYRQAIKNPDIYFVGMDSHPESMARMSWKVGRKPSRGGGQKNVAFVWSALENVPSKFSYLADSLSVNFPWGSLLKGVVSSETFFLNKLVSLAKPGASLELLLNYSIFKDQVYVRSLGLPSLNPEYVRKYLIPKYAENGIKIESCKIEQLAKNRTSWGQKLTLGSGREVITLKGTIKKNTGVDPNP